MKLNTSINDIVLKAKQIFVVGKESLSARPIGVTAKKLLQTGVLSTLVAVQLFGAVIASPISGYEHVKSLSDKVSTHQIQDISQEAQQFTNPQLINPLEHTIEGRQFIQDNNTIDSSAILNKWQESDISPQIITYLTEMLNHTQSPTFVTTQKEKDAVIEMAQQTKDIFTLSSEDEAIDFLMVHNPNQLSKDNLISPVSRQVNSYSYEGDIRHYDAVDYWNSFSILSDGNINNDANQNTSMQESIDMVNLAVQESGLSSVKVPIQMWTSPEKISDVAIQINNLNTLAQDLTGWSGPVLGLNGRNSIHFGSANENAAVGASNFFDNGQIIYGRSNTIIHEFAHVIDLSLSYDLGFQSNPEMISILPASVQEQILSSPSSDSKIPTLLSEVVRSDTPITNDLNNLASTWENLLDEISSNSYSHEDSFYRSLDEQMANGTFDEFESNYYGLEYERIAFSFEGYALSKSNDIAKKTGMSEYEQEIPMYEEAESSHVIWERAFEGLNDWWEIQLQRNNNNMSLDIGFEESVSIAPLNAKNILSQRVSPSGTNAPTIAKFG